MPLETINPATGDKVQSFPELTPAELDAKLDAAIRAFRLHRRTSFAERAGKLMRAADLFEAEQDRLAHLMALEVGKPLAQGRAEAVKCGTAFRYYAKNGEAMMRDERVSESAYVRYEPLGVVLALMPWNYPFWQVIRFAAPALMAGNVGVLKHADNVPQCAVALEELLLRAGFSPGCFQNLAVTIPRIEGIIEDSRIAAVTLTGSVPAGRAVAAAAGKKLKPIVLELGGSDPFIVLPSTDLEKTVAVAINARTQNCGQSCIAAKRFIVHQEVYDRFTEMMVRGFQALRVGDPLVEGTEVGPLAHQRGLEALERQVQEAVKAGATILTGGRRQPGRGFYFEPTILADLPRDSAIYREEMFGPVALLFRARDFEEAIEIANDTPFGLGASIWTSDPAEQQRGIAEIEAGQVFVNAMVASSPELPFGGVKISGHGRELGAAGLREFVNAKSVRLS